jgi:hypothetical protein
MRVSTRFELCILTCAVLLGGCADEDAHVDPNAPLAEFRFDVPAPLPESQQVRVLLLLDTSGSMQWRETCACETPSCSECLPDCAAGETSRWHRVLEALTGSFAQASCELVPRSSLDAGFSYDRSYAIPDVKLGDDLQQRDDGLLERYGAYVRFGVATFDSVGAYDGADALVPEATFDWSKSRGEQGMSSYAGSTSARARVARVRADDSVVGRVNYPASAGPYLIDTGIRSESASEGALVLPRADETRSARHTRIAQQLRGVRPFGTSPVAAALDDVSFALQRNPGGARDYVVLLTDGLPDDDFRKFPVPGCDCDSFETCGEDPRAMSCPYPLPAQAARNLRCGGDKDDDACEAAQLFVLGLANPDETLQGELDGIAAAGGSDSVRFVSGLSELNAALDAIVMRVVRATSP